MEYLTIEHLTLAQIQRIFRRIKADGEVSVNGARCWEWQGCPSTPYALTSFQGGQCLLHRLLYAWTVEPIPKGHGKDIPQLDHLCRNTKCVNPAHLELVSMKENIRRGTSPFAQNAAKTHCKRGHLLSDSNVFTNKQGWRECRTCRNWRYATDPERERKAAIIRAKRYYEQHTEELREKRKQAWLKRKESRRQPSVLCGLPFDE